MIVEAKGPSSYQNKNKTLWRKTISVQDRHCWNKLPSNIKEINSVSLFKKKLEQRTCMACLATYQTYQLFCMVLSVDKLSLLLLLLLLSLLLLLLLLSIIPQ